MFPSSCGFPFRKGKQRIQIGGEGARSNLSGFPTPRPALRRMLNSHLQVVFKLLYCANTVASELKSHTQNNSALNPTYPRQGPSALAGDTWLVPLRF